MFSDKNNEIHHHLGAIWARGNRLVNNSYKVCLVPQLKKVYTQRLSRRCQMLSAGLFPVRKSLHQTLKRNHFPPLFNHLEAGQWPFKSPSWGKGLRFLKQPPLAKSVQMRLWLLAGTKGTQLCVWLYVLSACVNMKDYMCRWFCQHDDSELKQIL